MEHFTCSTCGRTLPTTEFYKRYKNREYYKDRCKDCICKAIENGGLTKMCELMDIPLVYAWLDYKYQSAQQRYGKNPIARQWFSMYIAYINLNDFQWYRFQDSDHLNAWKEYQRVVGKFRKKYGVFI